MNNLSKVVARQCPTQHITVLIEKNITCSLLTCRNRHSAYTARVIISHIAHKLTISSFKNYC